jgi:hypothetical protein
MQRSNLPGASRFALHGVRLGLAGTAALIAGPAAAQTTFSIDYKGPTIAIPGPIPITEGDLLMPVTGFPAPGPLPPPVIAIAGGGLGLPLWPGCVGHPPGIACGVEVDALSYGVDMLFTPGMPRGSFKFSVDRFPVGIPSPVGPSVFSEAPIGEAPTDVFIDVGPGAWPCGFVPPFGFPPVNWGLYDGDGLPGPSPFAYPGTGLIEPVPLVCVLPSPGDNLDAVDVDGPIVFPVYYSLDNFGPDFPCGFAMGGSAAANGGFSAADILISPAGGPPAVWAPAGLLGLDMAGFSTDDLDALVLLENGTGVPEIGPCPTWGGPTDMILFSVRATSAVVGVIDPITGLPIEPGDILMPPVPPLIPGQPPTIFIAAENLGLSTFRFFGFPDDMDALDITAAMIDCNGNGIEDGVDLFTGADVDCNGNLVLDSCESPVTYCTAGTSASGCTALLTATGTASASAPTGFVVAAATVEGLKDGLFFYGQNGRQANPWGNGTSYQCVVPPVRRGGLLAGVGTVGACDGSFTQDLNARWCPGCPKPAHAPAPGTPLQIQLWYRDPANTSNQTTSLSDALEVIPCP